MKIASSALASSPLTAVFPLVPFCLSCIVLATFLVAFFSLHTMPITLEDESMQWLSDNVVAFKLTLLFCCVWHVCFLTGLQKVQKSDQSNEFDMFSSIYHANSRWRLLEPIASTTGMGAPHWPVVFGAPFAITLDPLVLVHLSWPRFASYCCFWLCWSSQKE